MNHLIDRYLAAVARELPDRQRADIVAELRDELMTGLEVQEDSLGRPLTRAELEAALVEFGNPLVLAGRYRKVQHLIGPEMFPFWWAALKASLVVVAAVYLVVAILAALVGHPAQTGDRLPDLGGALVFTFGIVTLICALVERFGKPGTFGRWHPRGLPPVEGAGRGRFEMLVEIGMGVVFLLWWTGAIHFRNVLPAVGWTVEMAPVWQAWFWPILAYGVFELVTNVLSLLRPAHVPLNRSLRIVRSLAGAGICLGLLQAGHWLVVSGPAAVAQANFDRGMSIGISVTAVILLGVALADAWRLRQFLQVSARRD